MKSVFVSSTFKDMQAERDLLQYRIFPKLRQELMKAGEDITFLDLRWGVDTIHLSEEESGKLVLKVCIDAIDRCIPFVIVFLGERYGWIPDQDMIHHVHDERVSSCYSDGMSVTNLEIEYGAFRKNEHLDRCIFCFRDSCVNDQIEKEYHSIYLSESIEHHHKLEELKSRIRQQREAEIIDYTASWDSTLHQITHLDELEGKLYQALKEKIMADLEPVNPHPASQIALEAKSTQRQMLNSYVRRYRDEAAVLSKLISVMSGFRKKQKNVLIRAAAGTGKTALISQIAKCAENLDTSVILYYSGNSGCQNIEVFERTLIYQLEEITGEPHADQIEFLEDRLVELNTKINHNTHILCFVDALDQMFPNSHLEDFNVLNLCSKVFFVMTSLDDFHLSDESSIAVCTLQTLSEQHIYNMISSTTAHRGKKLDQIIQSEIVNKNNSKIPLYLSNVLQRLFMMSGKEFEAAESLAAGIDGIHLYMKMLLQKMPETQEEMILHLINEAISLFDNTQFTDILYLIACSRSGLTENEIRDLLQLKQVEFQQLLFSQMTTYLYDVFVQKENGKWTLKHRLYYQAVLRNDTSEALDLLCRYAITDESFRNREGIYYLLENRHLEGARLFEHPHFTEITDFLAGQIQRDESFSDYLLQIAEIADAQACFSSCMKMQHHLLTPVKYKICQSLYQNKLISVQNQARWLEELFNENAHDQSLAQFYLQQMKSLADQDDFAEYIYSSSKGYYEEVYEKAYIAAVSDSLKAMDALQICFKEHEEDELAVRLTSLAIYIYQLNTKLKQYNPEILENTLHQIRSLLNQKESERKQRSEIQLLAALCRAYGKPGFFDMKKAGTYRDEAVSKCEILLKKKPSYINHQLMKEVQYAAATTKKAQYTYLHYQRAVECMKEAVELTQQPYDCFELANTLTKYADSLTEARKAGTTRLPLTKIHQMIEENYLTASDIYDELYQSYPQKFANCQYYAIENRTMSARKLLTLDFSERKNDYEQTLLDIIHSDDFQLCSQMEQCHCYAALIFSYLRTRRYKEAVPYVSEYVSKTEALVQQNRKYIIHQFRSTAYQCELSFELYDDQKVIESYHQAVQHLKSIKLTDELEHFEAKLALIRGAMSIERNEELSEYLPVLQRFTQKHDVTFSNHFYKSSYDLIEVVDAILNQRFEHSVSITLYEIFERTDSQRIRKLIKEIMYRYCIQHHQLDLSETGFMKMNLKNAFPEATETYLQYLNEVVSSYPASKDRDLIEIRAHYAWMVPEIKFNDDMKRKIAQHWFACGNYETVLDTYRSITDTSLMKPEDDFAVHLSEQMIQWMNHQPVILSALMDDLDFENPFHRALSGIWHTLKLTKTMDPQDFLNAIHPFLIHNKQILYAPVQVFSILDQSFDLIQKLTSEELKSIVQNLVRLTSFMTYEYHEQDFIYDYHKRIRELIHSRDWSEYSLMLMKKCLEAALDSEDRELQKILVEQAVKLLDRNQNTHTVDLSLSLVDLISRMKPAFLMKGDREIYIKTMNELTLYQYNTSKNPSVLEDYCAFMFNCNDSISGCVKAIPEVYIELIQSGETHLKPVLIQLLKEGSTQEYWNYIELEDQLYSISWTHTEQKQLKEIIEQKSITEIESKLFTLHHLLMY